MKHFKPAPSDIVASPELKPAKKMSSVQKLGLKAAGLVVTTVGLGGAIAARVIMQPWPSLAERDAWTIPFVAMLLNAFIAYESIQQYRDARREMRQKSSVSPAELNAA